MDLRQVRTSNERSQSYVSRPDATAAPAVTSTGPLPEIIEKAVELGTAREAWAIATDPNSTPEQVAAEEVKVDKIEAEVEKQ